MSLVRLKRLQRLEARQPRGAVYWVIPHLLAFLDGRPYSVLPAPEVERTEEQEQAIAAASGKPTVSTLASNKMIPAVLPERKPSSNEGARRTCGPSSANRRREKARQCADA